MSVRLQVWIPQISSHPLLRSILLTTIFGIVLISFTPLQHLSYDCSFQLKPRTAITNAVLLYANQQTFNILGSSGSPLDRRHHARLINYLTDAGAKLIFYDFAFIQSNAVVEVDETLAQAIERNGNVVLVGSVEITEGPAGPEERIFPPIPSLLRGAKGWGHAELTENIIRRISGTYKVTDGTYKATDYAGWVAAQLINPSLFKDQNPDAERWLNYYRRGSNNLPLESCSFESVFSNDVTHAFFTNRIVFVGQMVPSKDIHSTPFSRLGLANRMFGVEIHATALLNLISGDWLRPIPSPMQFLIISGIAVLVALTFYHLSRRSFLISVTFAIAWAACIAAASLWVQWRFGLWWSWIAAGAAPPFVALFYARRHPKPDPYFAFLSYRREDHDTVRLIFRELSDRGYKVFFDMKTAEVGDFPSRLFRGVADATFFILLLSPRSLDSSKDATKWAEDWVGQELRRAFSLKKPLIPIFKGGFQFETEGLPDFPELQALRHSQGVTYSNHDFDGFMNQLLQLLKEPSVPQTRAIVGVDT